MSEETRTPLPDVEETRSLIAMLLGRKVSAVPVAEERWVPRDREAAWAVFVDDSDRVAAYIACDSTFSLAAAISIAMFPPFRMKEHADDPVLPDNLASNLYEVLNVSASLFNGAGELHVRLKEVVSFGRPAPEGALERASDLTWREDLRITVDGYGGAGKLTILPL